MEERPASAQGMQEVKGVEEEVMGPIQTGEIVMSRSQESVMNMGQVLLLNDKLASSWLVYMWLVLGVAIQYSSPRCC